jgi:hypothetical protein
MGGYKTCCGCGQPLNTPEELAAHPGPGCPSRGLYLGCDCPGPYCDEHCAGRWERDAPTDAQAAPAKLGAE